MKKKTAALGQTYAILDRTSEAAELEKRRLDITREMEKLMKEYSKITGDKQYSERKRKVGSAPNDWKPIRK